MFIGEICSMRLADQLWNALSGACILGVWICSGNNWTQDVSSAQSVLVVEDLLKAGSKKHFTVILNSFVVKLMLRTKMFDFYPSASHNCLSVTPPTPPSPPHSPPQKPHHRPQTGLCSFWGSGDCLSWPPSTSRPQHSVLMKEAAQAECDRCGVVSLDSIIWMLTPGSLPHRCGYLLCPDKQTLFPLAICRGQLVRH